MKKSIKLCAILSLVSVFIAGIGGAQPKAINSITPPKNVVIFSSLQSNGGVGVKIEKNTPGKAVVIISDEYGNVLFKQVLSTGKEIEKDYILNKLDNGNYTIAVTSNKKVMEKNIRVHDGQCSIL